MDNGPLYGDDIPTILGHYDSYIDLLIATNSRFLGTRKLSRVGGGVTGACLYAHTVNGIGCGIGCHLPAPVAQHMDKFGMNIAGYFERQRFLDDVRAIEVIELAKQITKVINVERIGLENLLRLQTMHDNSEDVKEFLARLDFAITVEGLREPPLP